MDREHEHAKPEPAPRPEREAARPDEDEDLDETIEDSFPASDPSSGTRSSASPGKRIPPEKR